MVAYSRTPRLSPPPDIAGGTPHPTIRGASQRRCTDAAGDPLNPGVAGQRCRVVTIGVAALTLVLTAGCAGPGGGSTTIGHSTAVERVVDGDTFIQTGGARVRVLGIDSCETGTPGGARASAQARQLLDGTTVVLRAEPGVDLDRFGRELRYVTQSDGRDYGSVMVAGDHTSIYQGRNDADPAYLEQLRRADLDGRDCRR